MTQLGQHPEPTHVIAHLSDPHLLGGGRLLYDAVDTRQRLVEALDHLEQSGVRPRAIVFTGDLADLGEPEAYRLLRETVEPVASRMGSEVVWVMGNHDERAEYQSVLLGETPTDASQDRVYDLDGLRLVVLDSTVPGFHHGDVDADQLRWLADVLAAPAPHGTLLAMHHPPLASPLELMTVLELRHQHDLAEVVRGTDVRGILAGHLHYSSHGTFASIPVSVSAATCYLLDAGSPRRTMVGRAGGQAFSLVHVYDDTVVHSIVPVGDLPDVSRFSERFVSKLVAMPEEERLETFSRKSSTITVSDVEDS